MKTKPKPEEKERIIKAAKMYESLQKLPVESLEKLDCIRMGMELAGIMATHPQKSA